MRCVLDVRASGFLYLLGFLYASGSEEAWLILEDFQTGMTQSLFVNADVMAYMQAITPYWTGNNTLRNVVKAALFLVSPDAMWLTGVALEEDGGATA
jgi:NAD(P)-dependent dehydrogenase (short-subunit alcohol dehydrogenase family)